MKKTLTCTLRSAILFFCLSLYPAYFNAQTSDIFYVESPVRFQGLTTDNSQSRVIAADANGNLFFKDVSSLSNPGLWLNSGANLYYNNGNVGIGTTPQSAYKLAVNGVVGARKVKVTAETWADYVFEKEYHLPTLSEVEQFIQQHRHLPDMPSAKEVSENGLDLGDNQALLLKKIEELTLYIIELNKEIKRLDTAYELLKLETK